MNMKRFYDATHKRLAYFGETASENYWDEHWERTDGWKSKLENVRDTFVTSTTRKYLEPHGGLILEGGCGSAVHLAALSKHGFSCMGIDSAPKTIALLKKIAPYLEVRQADVRRLPLDDGAVSGYWSIGVIEHAWNGFDDMADEMARVVRGGGYLFLTFPWMSPLRKLKSKLGCYPRLCSTESQAFYQFALDGEAVVANIERRGFQLVEARPFDALKGLKDEIPFKIRWLQQLYNSNDSSKIKSWLEYRASKWLGHSLMAVFKRVMA